MTTRDDLIEAARPCVDRLRTRRIADHPGGPKVREGLGRDNLPETAAATVDAILDALASRVPSVCPSGFDWTAGDIEDWLRAVREGRA
jgi:hypothetical protein